MTKTNEALQQDVLMAIKWEPLFEAAEIGVSVVDGIVSLTGVVDNLSKKEKAELVALNVNGVQAVVVDIQVKSVGPFKRYDVDIAEDILSALDQTSEVVKDSLKVRVENGKITLDGILEWSSQRIAAKRSIENIKGITKIIDNISIRSNSINEIEKSVVETSIEHCLIENDSNISVSISKDYSKLPGIVD